MKNIILPVLIIFALNGFAQTPQPTPVTKGFQIGISFSPDLCYRSLSSEIPTQYYYGYDVVKTRNENEIHKIGYTTGISMGYNFNSSVGLETGVLFSNKGYQTKDLSYFIMSGTTSASIVNVKARYKMHFIDIPLRINYTFGKKRLRAIASAGAVANIIVERKITQTAKFTDRSQTTTKAFGVDGTTRVNLSPSVSLGVDYSITDKLSFRAEPTFRYQVFSAYKNSNFAERFYNYGLNLGLYMKL